MRVQFLRQEDRLEKEMATHSSLLALRISRTEEPSGLQSMGLQRVGHDSAAILSKPEEAVPRVREQYPLQPLHSLCPTPGPLNKPRHCLHPQTSLQRCTCPHPNPKVCVHRCHALD